MKIFLNIQLLQKRPSPKQLSEYSYETAKTKRFFVESAKSSLSFFLSEYLYFCRPLQSFGSCCVSETVVFVISKFFLNLFRICVSSSHMRMDDEELFAKNDHFNLRSYRRRNDGILERII